jgi:hypothetical protein
VLLHPIRIPQGIFDIYIVASGHLSLSRVDLLLLYVGIFGYSLRIQIVARFLCVDSDH